MVLLIIGILVGIGLTLIVLYYRAPSLMLTENESKFSFEETEVKLTESLEEINWKLLNIHDLQAKMKANGYDVLDAKVFDVCKPELASKILKNDEERIVSPLMPCRIAIYKRSNGKTYFSRLNSGLIAKPMMGVVPEVMKIAATEIELLLKPLTLER